MNIKSILILLSHIFVSICNAQQISPVINNDNSVTFFINAPEAEKVQIEGSFIPPKAKFKIKTFTISKSQKYKMTKERGVWTYTTSPLKSEMYTYRYIVDGIPTLDSNNKNTVRDVADTLNYFFIQGDIANHYIDKDIPHGTLSYVWYPSTMNGMSQRRMAIYTPYNYEINSSANYPVLYLLHGSGGDETSWSDYGRVCQILDDMIYSGSCKPLIVVMPNGNIELDAAPGQSPYMHKTPSAVNVTSMLGQIESAFIPEVVTFTEKNYRVLTDKQNRAIAGLSLGGLQTLYISLNNPDYFDYIGLFSPQTTNMLNNKRISGLNSLDRNISNIKTIFSLLNGEIPSGNDLTNKINKVDIYENFDQKLDTLYSRNPKLLYIGIGEDDFVLKLVTDFRAKLDNKQYKYYYNYTDGAHTWENWRKYLIDFLPKLFE